MHNHWTYGAELEYGDCNRSQELPPGNTWSTKEETCPNSTGIANDPQNILYHYGGEINTAPTDTIEQQLQQIQDIHNVLQHPKPTVNHLHSLHIHIRIPGLIDDLETCKQLLRYINKYQDDVFHMIEPITQATAAPSYERARRRRSRQSKLPQARVAEALAAQTMTEFFEGHVHVSTITGKRLYHTFQRPGINLRQLLETETIEFRHFPATLDIKHIETAFRWCAHFLESALANVALDMTGWRFWKSPPYDADIQTVYSWTTLRHNKRAVVADRLNMLRNNIDIDDIEHVHVHDIAWYVRDLQLQTTGGFNI